LELGFHLWVVMRKKPNPSRQNTFQRTNEHFHLFSAIVLQSFEQIVIIFMPSSEAFCVQINIDDCENGNNAKEVY